MLSYICIYLIIAIISTEGFNMGRMKATRRKPLLSMLDRSDVLLFNSLSREKEVFRPLKEGNHVSFYSCGPTVYDFAHIGNFRAFLTYDILKRWLTYCGYDVEHVCNLTDIDDKIIIKMAEEGKTLEEVTNYFADAFFQDLDVLNIIPASTYPRATEHVDDIINMVSKLIEKGFAYVSEGSVYFRVDKFNNYGKLADRDFSKDESGAGTFGPNERRGSSDKENVRDFVLWKTCGAEDAVGYNSPFGRGRPGWHIECSAMIDKLLGPTIDVHAGGVDLVFPHHQNEIAQSECYSGEPLCKYWVHNGFVNINNEKMSKSLKNFKTLRDIAKAPSDARAFRFMVVSAQYRAPLNFTPETLKAAINSLKRIDRVVGRLAKIAAGEETLEPSTGDLKRAIDIKEEVSIAMGSFERSMCDDMNTPRASAALFGLLGAAEKLIKAGVLSTSEAAMVEAAIHEMDRVFGILYDVQTAYFGEDANAGATQKEDRTLVLDELPQDVRDLVVARVDAKVAKDWVAADAARDELAARGYGVKDNKDGSYDVFRV